MSLYFNNTEYGPAICGQQEAMSFPLPSLLQSAVLTAYGISVGLMRSEHQHLGYLHVFRS